MLRRPLYDGSLGRRAARGTPDEDGMPGARVEARVHPSRTDLAGQSGADVSGAAGLARPRRLARGGLARRFGPRRRRRAALPAALARRRLAGLLAAAGPRLLAAAGRLVDRGPGATLRLFLADAALLVALLDVAGLALLLRGVARLVAARHDRSPLFGRCMNGSDRPRN